MADHKAEQLAVLAQQVTDLNEELRDLSAQLKTGMFTDPEADPLTVCGELDERVAHVAQIRAACETCADYQRLYELEADDLGQLALVEKELNHKVEVGGLGPWLHACLAEGLSYCLGVQLTGSPAWLAG